MKRSQEMALFVVVAGALVSTVAIAGNVTIPNSFAPGTVIRAADVNANFQAIKTANDANVTDIANLGTRVNALESPAPRVGAYTVGSLDFQPTVSGATNVVRAYDSFGADTVGGKIGAAIHPVHGSLPTRFGCWFTGPGTAFSTDKVVATIWRVSNTRGSQPVASIDMPALLITNNTPYYTSTQTFNGIDGTTAFNDIVGTDAFRYLVEMEFIGQAWPVLKVWGCTVEYTTTR